MRNQARASGGGGGATAKPTYRRKGLCLHENKKQALKTATQIRQEELFSREKFLGRLCLIYKGGGLYIDLSAAARSLPAQW